jgi:Holliday junction resolvasome RuvABC endonuclease subunit
MVTDSLQYTQLQSLIVKIEKSISEVNENVRKMETVYKIKEMDETMEFGTIADVIKFDLEV